MRVRIASAAPRELGDSLAAAMPWVDEPGRQAVGLRRRLDGPLWEAYLADRENRHGVGRARTSSAEEMEKLWAQGHHVRALGAYLVDVAIATAVSTRVTRSFGITVGSGDQAQVFVLGK